MAVFEKIVGNINDFVWGTPLIVLIIAVGIYLTVRTRVLQVFHLGKALRFIVQNEEGGKGEVSSFGALCTALSATIGTGNIVGVATAICLGGPGALLWMIIAAFFGMATKYAEGLLAVLYRQETVDGRYIGGPFYYIEKGMGKKWKPLAMIFAFFGTMVGILGIGTITQVNGITNAMQDFFDPARANVAFTLGGISYTWTTVIGGLFVSVFAAFVIIGGIKRIASFSEVIVPFMAVIYILFSIIILICNADKIPGAVLLIGKSAFSPEAALGAGCGITLKLAMQKGVGRGIFSNEAGLGSAPIASAAAKTNDPVRQGLVTMTGTFIDTIIVCTLTGLSIIVTGAHNMYAEGAFEGASITNYAWQTGLPFPTAVSSFFLMACLALFAFTTILGWDYYSERCLEYLTGGNMKIVKVYRWLYIIAVLIGPYLTVSLVWDIADVFNGLMAFPNLIALIMLSPVVAKETKNYFKKKQKK